MVIYLVYGGFYRNRHGDGDSLASLTPSPLGCCGALSLQALSYDDEVTVDECREIFAWLDRNRRGYRALMAVPIQHSPGEDNSDVVDWFIRLWADPAIDCGWDILGKPWLNPNTNRVLQMYYKDLKT